MALDYMAIVSNGSYPTPGSSLTERSALGVSYGLLTILAELSGVIYRGLSRLGHSMRLN